MMKPTDFQNATPQLTIEEYFNGRVEAYGLFEDRFGTLRRQFTVTIDGDWDGERLILDEAFTYSDGETDRRVWTIHKKGPHEYEGAADDIVGVASGEAYGNALNWRYSMDLKIGDSSLRVQFDDWMFLVSPDVMMNRAKVSKFGIEIGTVTLAFVKKGDPETAALKGGEWRSVAESAIAATR